VSLLGFIKSVVLVVDVLILIVLLYGDEGDINRIVSVKGLSLKHQVLFEEFLPELTVGSTVNFNLVIWLFLLILIVHTSVS
jgi:hypothetical protein